MIKLTKASGMSKTSSSSAQALLDKSLKPSFPLDELHKAILKRLEQLRDEGLAEEEAIQALFPTTVLDIETLEEVVSTLLAGNHMVLFGPPGSGKTNLAKDIWELFPKRVWVVKDCPVQDHPYSLVDHKYSNVVQPCPQCKIKYGKVTEIGDFKIENVNPDEVPVVRLNLHEGVGFARLQGSPEVFPDNLTGTINIHKLEELGDPTSPLVIEPGKLLQANRGLLIIDEIGKLPLGTQNVLLQALQERIVTPAKSRDTYPASFIAVATSNLDDLDNINEPLNDRLTNIYVGFNKKHSNNQAILDINLSRREPQVFLSDIFVESSIYLVETWRRVAGEIHELSEVGSNRTMIDNVQRAVAYTVLNRSKSVTIEDFRRGVHGAMLGRIRARGGDSFIQNKATIEGFIEKHFDDELKRAANRYWCNFFNRDLKSNRSVGKKVLDECKTLLSDNKLIKKVLEINEGYSEFRKFAKYVKHRERFNGKLNDEKILMNVFKLLNELNVFTCEK